MINLTFCFYFHTLYHIKTTRIPTLPLLNLVNLIYLVVFLPSCLLPYQNDSDFHTTSFQSSQSDMCLLSRCIRRITPVAPTMQGVWVCHIFQFLLCLVRCLLHSQETLNLTYRVYGSWTP